MLSSLSADGRVLLAEMSATGRFCSPRCQRLLTEMWHLVNAIRSGCRFDVIEEANMEDCKAWSRKALTATIEMQPDLVVMTSTRGRGESENVPQGYLDSWEALEEAGIQVLALRDNPRGFEWIECMEANGVRSPQCEVDQQDKLNPVDPTSQLKFPPSNVTFVDLTPFLCDGRRCYPVIGNVFVYHDHSHLSATYVRTLVPMLLERLPPLAGVTLSPALPR